MKPLVWVSLTYGVIGALIILGFTPEPYSALNWYGLYYLAAVANLYFLSKVVAVTIGLMSHQETEKGPYSQFHLLVYGTAKLATLGMIFLLVWKGSSAPLLSMMAGLGTVVIVPLFGGLWISQRESTRDLRNA